MHPWAQDIDAELLCVSAWPTGKLHEVMAEAESKSLTTQQMPALPEQSSYLTSRPQEDSVCPRLD